MTTIDDLLAKAQSSIGGKWNEVDNEGSSKFAGHCLGYVARLLGLPSSGSAVDPKFDSPTAAYAWKTYPASLKHPGDRNPPVGAFVWWNDTVGNGAGHVAVVVAPGKIISNHDHGAGPKVYDLKNVMASAYAGWTPPALAGTSYQPASGWNATDNPGLNVEALNLLNATSNVTSKNAHLAPTDTGSSVGFQSQGNGLILDTLSDINGFINSKLNPQQIMAGVLASMFKPFLPLFLATTWIRIQAAIAGFILLVIGVVLLAWEG